MHHCYRHHPADSSLGHMEKPMNQMVDVVVALLEKVKEQLELAQSQVLQLDKLLQYQATVVEELRAENLRLQAESNRLV